METLDLSIFFTTPSQANDFKTRLSAVMENMYQTEFNFEMALLEQFGIQKRDKFIVFLRNNKVDVESKTALKEFLAKVLDQVAAIPILSLTLAFEPKEQTLAALSSWFLTNTNKQVMFEITVDPGLIAGTAITMNGKYLDFSLKPQFQTILKDYIANAPSPSKRPVSFNPKPIAPEKPVFTPPPPPLAQTPPQNNPAPTPPEVASPPPSVAIASATATVAPKPVPPLTATQKPVDSPAPAVDANKPAQPQSEQQKTAPPSATVEQVGDQMKKIKQEIPPPPPAVPNFPQSQPEQKQPVIQQAADQPEEIKQESTPPSPTVQNPAPPPPVALQNPQSPIIAQPVANTPPNLPQKTESNGGMKWRFFTKFEHKKSSDV